MLDFLLQRGLVFAGGPARLAASLDSLVALAFGIKQCLLGDLQRFLRGLVVVVVGTGGRVVVVHSCRSKQGSSGRRGPGAIFVTIEVVIGTVVEDDIELIFQRRQLLLGACLPRFFGASFHGGRASAIRSSPMDTGVVFVASASGSSPNPFGAGGGQRQIPGVRGWSSGACGLETHP